MEVAGLGLQLLVSGRTLEALPKPGSKVRLHSHLHVREDLLQLYGFADPRREGDLPPTHLRQRHRAAHGPGHPLRLQTGRSCPGGGHRGPGCPDHHPRRGQEVGPAPADGTEGHSSAPSRMISPPQPTRPPATSCAMPAKPCAAWAIPPPSRPVPWRASAARTNPRWKTSSVTLLPAWPGNRGKV